MNYSKGISWIDDCRIPFVDERDIPSDMDKTNLKENRLFIDDGGYKPFLYEQNTIGRFPANLLVSDDMLNDGSITSQGNIKLHYGISGKWGEPNIKKNEVEFKGDKGTNSRYYDIDKWFEKMINEL